MIKIKRTIKYLLKRKSIPHINIHSFLDVLLKKTPMYYRYDTTSPKQIYEDCEIISNSLKESLFAFTSIISFELSNICNYSCYHTKCIASSQTEKQILPIKKILEVIEEIRDYDKIIQFNLYNEPLIDPRLFFLIQYTKENIPKCKIHILTNGFYLNQIIADELTEFGVDYLTCTAYSSEEFNRLSKIKITMPFIVSRGRLDNRLSWYDSEGEISEGKCNAPYNELIIRCNGDIGLCCMDAKNQHSFGNIYEKRLSDIILSKRMMSAYYELMHGKRTRNICKHCVDSK